MMRSYSGHCWCYKGSGGPSSREPLVAAGAVEVLGFAGCRATGEVEVPGGLKDVAKGNVPGRDSALAPTGGESRGADVDGGGCGGLLQV